MIPQKKPSPRQQAPTNNDEETRIDYSGAAHSSGNKKSIIFILCFLGAAAIGVGAYFLIKSNQKAKETQLAEKRAEETEEYFNEQQQKLENYRQELLLEEEQTKLEDEEELLPEPEEIDLPEEILRDETFTVTEVVEAEEASAPGTTNFDRGTEDLNVVSSKSDVNTAERIHQPQPKIFTSVEQMPQFPGGESAMLQYLSSHIKYPEMAMENGVQGRVVVQFVVKKDGSIGDVKVARGKDPELDREAVRVVKTFPKFTPGKMNGQPVDVWYTLPINFKLQGK